MKKGIKIIIASLTILTISFIIYISFPRYGSFEKLVLNNFSGGNFHRLSMFSMDKKNSKANKCEDTITINKFLEYVGKYKIIEYRKTPPYSSLAYTRVDLYTNLPGSLSLSILHPKYIRVNISINGTTKKRTYKILGEGIDLKYLEKLLENYVQHESE
jgi:hypothetical protein